MALDAGLWQRRIEESRRVRMEQWAPQARDSVMLYEGKPTISSLTNEEVPINVAATYIRALVAVVYSSDPSWVVYPLTEASEKSAPVLQQLLAYWWKAFGLKREVRLALIDALLTGWGWMEYGYQAEFGQEGTPPSPSQKGMVDKALDSIISFVSGKKGTERQTESGHVIEFNEFVRKESLFGRRINPFMMLTPVGINDYRYYPWLGYEFTVYEEDLAYYPRLAKFKDRLTPSDPRGKLPQVIKTSQYTPAAKPVGRPTADRPYRFSKIWDKRSQQRLIFGDGVQEPLTADPWPYDFDGFPITPFAPIPVPETDQTTNPYPLSALQTAKPLLKELTKLYTAMSENRKRFPTKLLFDGKVPDEVVTWINNEDVGGAIKVNGLIASQGQLVKELTLRTNNSNLQMEYGLITRLLELMLNVQLISGVPQQGVDTATESANLQSALMAQVRELQDKVEDFTEEGASRLLAMREFIDQEQVFKITSDPQMAQAWVNIVPSSVPGDYGVRVEVGSTGAPRDMAIIRKQLMDFANIMMPFHQAGLTSVDFDKLMKRVAYTFPPEVIRSIDDIFATGEVEESQLIQEENALLLQGLPAAVHPRDNHALHIPGHGGPDGQQGGATPAMAVHIMLHHQFMKGKVQPNGSLAGASGGAANPTATRSMGTMPDVLQGLRNQGAGTGVDTNATGLGA